MDFLANENFPLDSIKFLRNFGHNISSIMEETPGAKDLEVLKRACIEKRAILTFDKDYGELIYRNKLAIPLGLIYFRFVPYMPLEPAEILLRIIGNNKITLESMFTVIERDRIRQRKLPEVK